MANFADIAAANNTPPVQQAPAPPQNPAPADVSASPAPDMSGALNGLSAPGPNYQTAALGSANEAAAGVQKSMDQYNKDRAVSTVPVPGPHARLMAMVSGLATGLGAAGTALATHGREGGVQEVTQVQGEEQRQKLEAQAARDTRKNQTLQQDLVNASNQMELMKMYTNLASLPDEMAAKHLEIAEKKQALTAGAVGIDTQIANFQRENFGLMPPSQSGGGANAPVTPDERTRVNRSLDSAIALGTGVLTPGGGVTPSPDPILSAAIKNAQDVRNNPNASRGDIQAAGQSITNAIQNNAAVVAARTKQSQSEEAASKAATAGPLAQAQLKEAQAGGTLKEAQAEQLTPPPPSEGRVGEAYIATLPTRDQETVRSVGEGRLDLKRWDYLLARQPKLAEEVTAAYPDFNSSRIKAYNEAYPAFTTGPESKQLVAGNVVLQHLQQLKQINDASPDMVKIRGTAANKQYNNLLTTVTGELVTFYGMPDTNESHEQLRSTLGGLVNRDAAIKEQAHAMGVRLDELENKWKESSPSSAYASQMPNKMSQKAIAARAFLDPAYKPSQTQSRVVQSVGHKAGDVITQNGRNYVVAATDANGRVTGANPQ